MLKTFHNRPTTGGLTPWATNDDKEIASLLPQIIPKKKKKKPKNHNLENQQPGSTVQKLNQQQSHSHTNLPQAQNKAIQLIPDQLSSAKPKPDDKENNLNFIKKSKKYKSKTQSKNRQILCPKPPTSQRKYIRSSNYLTLQDQMALQPNQKNQLLFKEIINTQNPKNQNKKIKDIHSLYLIEKLKGISNTLDPIKCKESQQKSKISSHNPFLDYLSQNNGYRQHQKRILTQRCPKQFSLKTQGHENVAKDQLNFLKKTTKNSSYLTHRKQILKNNEDSAILWSENQHFNIESTFALKTSTVLKTCKQAKSMQMKCAGNKSNLLKPGKINEQQLFEETVLEGKFSGIELQSRNPRNIMNSLPLQPISYELNQMQSVELPAMKAKVSFMIQKSQFSVRAAPMSKQKALQREITQMGVDEQMSIKMDQEIKRNLRKLRCYLVKKTRDHCMQKGNLDENQLLIYQSNQNYFRTE